MINSVEEFILFDDAQYTKRDWRNRNLLKTPKGLKWISIPIQVTGKFTQKIFEARIADPNWGKVHWDSIQHNYGKAPYFSHYEDELRDLYLRASPTFLSDINFSFIQFVARTLGIKTKLTWSRDFNPRGESPTELLLDMCQKAKATDYLSGPLARNYLETDLFENAKIKVTWFNYENYPTYNQLYPPFEHGVTILDLILNMGPEAPSYMKSMRGPSAAVEKKASGA